MMLNGDPFGLLWDFFDSWSTLEGILGKKI